MPFRKNYVRPAGEKIGLQGVGWHSFRQTYRTLIDDIGTPLGAQQRASLEHLAERGGFESSVRVLSYRHFWSKTARCVTQSD
jgi:hypothetical protein